MVGKACVFPEKLTFRGNNTLQYQCLEEYIEMLDKFAGLCPLRRQCLENTGMRLGVHTLSGAALTDPIKHNRHSLLQANECSDTPACIDPMAAD